MNKKVLITAGPTYEKIDPVRFIGNYSSGKMGFALAQECADRGAEVVLVSGPVGLQINHPLITRLDVTSAQEMFDMVMKHFPSTDVAILCAAVADFTPEKVQHQKVKRGDDDLVLHLKPTQDIAAHLGKIKKAEQTLVGFALETQNETKNAHYKLLKKNLDFIVLNSLQDANAGFMHDTNKITIHSKDGVSKPYKLKSKIEVAMDIIDFLESLLNK